MSWFVVEAYALLRSLTKSKFKKKNKILYPGPVKGQAGTKNNLNSRLMFSSILLLRLTQDLSDTGCQFTPQDRLH